MRFRLLSMLVPVLASSCANIRSYDPLVHCKPGRDPNRPPELRTDGFYCRMEPVMTDPRTFRFTDHYAPLYFYADGSVARGTMHPSLESLREWNLRRDSGGCRWGFYRVEGNLVRMEFIDRSTGTGSRIAERWTMLAALDGGDVVVFSHRDRRGVEHLGECKRYSFMEFDAVPAVSNNWIKADPRYAPAGP